MIVFPDVAEAGPDGLLCVSAHLNAALLWAGYRQGAFPWTDAPVGWFAPAQRGVLCPNQATFPSNTRKLCRKGRFVASADRAFADVVRGCRQAHAQDGEWITDNFVAAYTALHQEGHAHSIEIWQDGALCGGLYGVEIGGLFAAESMFGRVPNASRAALFVLCQMAAPLGLRLIDVQVLTEATVAHGAVTLPRATFMAVLAEARAQLRPRGRRWPIACEVAKLGLPDAALTGSSRAPAGAARPAPAVPPASCPLCTSPPQTSRPHPK